MKNQGVSITKNITIPEKDFEMIERYTKKVGKTFSEFLRYAAKEYIKMQENLELKEFLRYEKFFKDNYNYQLEQEVWIAAKSIESMFHDSRKINTLTVVKAGVPMHLSYFTDHFEPRKKDQPIWSYYQYAADIKRSMSYPEQAKLIFGGAKVIVVKTMIGERRFNDVILRSSVVLILVILIQQHLNYIKAKRK